MYPQATSNKDLTHALTVLKYLSERLPEELGECLQKVPAVWSKLSGALRTALDARSQDVREKGEMLQLVSNLEVRLVVHLYLQKLGQKSTGLESTMLEDMLHCVP